MTVKQTLCSQEGPVPTTSVKAYVTQHCHLLVLRRDCNNDLPNSITLIKKGEKCEKIKQSSPCSHWFKAVRTWSSWLMCLLQKILYIVVVDPRIKIVHQFNLLMLLLTLINNRGAAPEKGITRCTDAVNMQQKHELTEQKSGVFHQSYSRISVIITGTLKFKIHCSYKSIDTQS